MSDQQMAWGHKVSAAMTTLVGHLAEHGEVLSTSDHGPALCWWLTPDEWDEVYAAAAVLVDLAPLMRTRLHESPATTQEGS